MPEITSKYFELHVIDEINLKCLLLRRSDLNKIYPGIWQMITGTVENNESTRSAIIRELYEETGLEPNKIYSIHRINTFYLASSDLICMSPVFFTFPKNNHVRISPEHDEFRWLDFDKACELIHWPNQIESLKIIQKYLSRKELFSKLTEV
ncbi:MAG: NUDIX domain-containing protein [Ignavibacteria bacterium]|nr:NUDIX domain-containing protein [Ignavibacteria bacterium]